MTLMIPEQALLLLRKVIWMNLSMRKVIDIIPLLASVSLWAIYILDKEALLAAILMSIYTVVLYLTSKKQKLSGVIEMTVNDEGTKTFQLVLDKDPHTFEDKDEVIFKFKDVS